MLNVMPSLKMLDEDRTHELRFAEEMGLLFESGGSPRMAGRVWAMLLVADEPHLSARDLQDRLGASAGSISTATRFLLQLGLIERKRMLGERRDYFTVRQGAIADLVRWRLERLAETERMAEIALDRFGNREHARPRLEEIHSVYHWYVRELPALHERFLAEQAQPTHRGDSR